MSQDTNIQKIELNTAKITYDKKNITIKSGLLTRILTFTDSGLATEAIEYDSKTLAKTTPSKDYCDWYLFHLTSPHFKPELTDIKLEKEESPSLTMPYIKAVLEFKYPKKDFILRYNAQVFPSAEGIRTWISVRALKPFGKDEFPSVLLQSYADSFPFKPENFNREAVGYYNDPQHRNHDDTPVMLKEKASGKLKSKDRELYDRHNILFFEKDNRGLILVKESHKCVNQHGIDTGEFVLNPDRVKITGVGFKANNYVKTETWLQQERFRDSWAVWLIPYKGKEGEKQLALKKFDRARFQPNPGKDARSRANTWGSRKPGDPARDAAEQENIIRELKSCAELGIDELAIDDGWQYPPGGNNGKEITWRPDPERFPEGWCKIREEAKNQGVNLNLWMPGYPVSLENMIRNIEEGEFTGLKIDFLGFHTRDILDLVMNKIKRVVKHTDYNLKISWDVTEESSRLGFYFGREFGTLHTSNRKPTYDINRVNHIAYTPRLVLRDAWHLSHYVNLNQIEIPVQDVDIINPEVSNASSYSHDYITIMALPGMPLFFQETQFLKKRARELTKKVMHKWREHREAMAEGYTFPIGEEPCDRSWTGFQQFNPHKNEGYFLLFREVNAPDKEKELPVFFLNNTHIKLKDIMNGQEEVTKADNGKIKFRIPKSPGYKWLKYETE